MQSCNSQGEQPGLETATRMQGTPRRRCTQLEVQRACVPDLGRQRPGNLEALSMSWRSAAILGTASRLRRAARLNRSVRSRVRKSPATIPSSAPSLCPKMASSSASLSPTTRARRQRSFASTMSGTTISETSGLLASSSRTCRRFFCDPPDVFNVFCEIYRCRSHQPRPPSAKHYDFPWATHEVWKITLRTHATSPACARATGEPRRRGEWRGGRGLLSVALSVARLSPAV